MIIHGGLYIDLHGLFDNEKEIFFKLTLLDLTHEQLVHGSIEWIGLSKMQLYSKSLFFELDKWNFGSSIVLESF